MENEIKMDGRVSPEALLEKRKQVICLYKKGMKLKDISEATGLCWQAIRNAIDLFEQHGAKGLKPGRRGRPSGKGRRLAEEQEKQIQKDICDKRPEQLKMDFALWTREAVLVYIREHFGIDMPVRTVGEYLKRWGFTPQKPIKVAYEQKPEAVKEWLVTTYPSIAARGKTPTTCTVRGGRQRFSMISSVNNQGKCYWMVIDGTFNADRLIEFMESLIKEVSRKAFLVMDNLKVHHCKPVMAWLEEHKDKIEVFYLPSYSP